MEVGLAFGGLLVGWIVASTVLGPLQRVLPEGWPSTTAGLLAGPSVTAIAALFYWQVATRWTREAPQEPQAVEQASVARTSWIAASALLAALAGSVLIGLLFTALGAEVEEQAVVLRIAEDAKTGGPIGPAIALCVSALLLAPAAEEWLFRGLLFRRLEVVCSPIAAYLTSAVAFSAIHNNPTGFIVYLWLGLVFAACYRATGRLGAAIAVHMGNNAFVLATLFWPSA